jgi:hypothetical protein
MAGNNEIRGCMEKSSYITKREFIDQVNDETLLEPQKGLAVVCS